MKVNKMKVIATIGALGLTAGVLAGCADNSDDDDYVKVVDKDGDVQYVKEDEYEHNSSMFLLFANWNGSNHSGLKSSKGYKGKSYKSNPSVTSGAKATKSSGSKSSSKSSGVGKASSGSKSGGFGG